MAKFSPRSLEGHHVIINTSSFWESSPSRLFIEHLDETSWGLWVLFAYHRYQGSSLHTRARFTDVPWSCTFIVNRWLFIAPLEKFNAYPPPSLPSRAISSPTLCSDPPVPPRPGCALGCSLCCCESHKYVCNIIIVGYMGERKGEVWWREKEILVFVRCRTIQYVSCTVDIWNGGYRSGGDIGLRSYNGVERLELIEINSRHPSPCHLVSVSKVYKTLKVIFPMIKNTPDYQDIQNNQESSWLLRYFCIIRDIWNN